MYLSVLSVFSVAHSYSNATPAHHNRYRPAGPGPALAAADTAGAGTAAGGHHGRAGGIQILFPAHDFHHRQPGADAAVLAVPEVNIGMATDYTESTDINKEGVGRVSAA